MIIKALSTPNQNGRHGQAIRCIVLHDTGGPTLDGAVSWCQNPASRVSYHYLIDIDGAVTQLVPDDKRAWHAGKAKWGGLTNVNSISLGVALVNDGTQPYPDEQVRAAAWLVDDLMHRHGLGPSAVTRHRDVALPAGRKNDPSDLFDFPGFLLLVSEVGAWEREPAPARPTLRRGDSGLAVLELTRGLVRLRFSGGVSGRFGPMTELAVRGFQRRHGRAVDGIVGPKTWAAIEKALTEKGGQP